MSTNSIGLYILFGIITGLLISWPGNSTNNPIFVELFPPEIRSSVFSVDRVFEGSIAAFGTTIVAAITTMFGFQNPPSTVSNVSIYIYAQQNAYALAQGIFWTCFVPWIFCLVLYTLVYRTYPKDAEAIKKELTERFAEIKNKEQQDLLDMQNSKDKEAFEKDKDTFIDSLEKNEDRRDSPDQ